MPDLETFFEFGGTLELLTLQTEDSTLTKNDLVMSEIMWAIDEGFDEDAGTGTVEIDNPDYDPDNPQGNGTPKIITIPVPQLDNQVIQWIELYNTTGAEITANLYFLFTPFESHPDRETVDWDFDGDGTDETYTVLDTVDTLFGGSWELPGKRGDRPDTAFVSAYRTIDYDAVESGSDRDAQLAGIPFGSEPDGWEATPDRGSRNTALKIIYNDKVVDLLAVGTPGAKHADDIFTGRLEKTPVLSDRVVINEIRNDTSEDNVDWIELKNVGTDTIELEDWELSIVTAAGMDEDLVDLPEYELEPGALLLLLNDYPWGTSIIEGVAVEEADQTDRFFAPRYVVDTALDLPNTGKFLLLLRSESDQNEKDNAIEDYAGNGFFGGTVDGASTLFWPRVAQSRPRNVAAFGNNTFASTGEEAWARIRYEEDDGHHTSAWEKVETKGGLGYDPGADLSTSPGTPGYENDALKSNDARSAADRELSDGDISISEIMYDPGRGGNLPQWIELYNSSRTEAINLKGWRMEIRNSQEETRARSQIRWTFEDAIILPNQTLLLASGKARKHEDLSSNRIYTLYNENREDLGLTDEKKLLLSPTAFSIQLTLGRTLVDAVGNLTTSGTEEKVWDLPAVNPGQRRSIVRVYAGNTAEDGNSEEGWYRFPLKGADETYYGTKTDLSNPGYRKSGPLPVTLSSFRPVRVKTGEVLIRWKTESELNNAGFNILRSESRDGDFTVINAEGIIPGYGTSSEMHIYSYTDKTAKPNVIYYYRIEDVSFDGAHQTLATVRLKGDVSATGKLTTMWGELKLQK